MDVISRTHVVKSCGDDDGSTKRQQVTIFIEKVSNRMKKIKTNSLQIFPLVDVNG